MLSKKWFGVWLATIIIVVVSIVGLLEIRQKKSVSQETFTYKKSSFYLFNQITRQYDYTGCLTENVKIKFTPDTLIVQRPSLIIGYKPIKNHEEKGLITITKNYSGGTVFFIRLKTPKELNVLYICDGERMVILCSKDSCIVFKGR